jgi:hypothetical protein
MIVYECPQCGAYTSEDDGHDDTFVVTEPCERCREADRNFDLGFGEYEDSLRLDREGR